MTDLFMTEIQTRLHSILPADLLAKVMFQIGCVATDYDITKHSRELAVITPELPEAYKAFMVTKKIEGLFAGTLENYSMYIKDFLLKCNKPLETITANDIRIYLHATQVERGISNRTLDSRRTALSSFFSWSAANEYIDKNPCTTIKPIKYTTREREPLTDMELEKVRTACKTVRERAIIELLYSSACRVNELSILKKKDINLVTGEVQLFGKGSKYRTSFISECAVLHLIRYWNSRSDDSDYCVVADRSPHGMMSRESIERIVKLIGDRAGIDHLHPHRLRHTSATHCLQRGMDVTQLKEMLGHCSLDTTMIYAKVDTSSIKTNHHKCII